MNFALPVEWIAVVKPGQRVVTEEHGLSEWLMRAIELIMAEDWQGLLACCQQWTKSEPNNTSAWASLGIAYGNLERYQDAIEACRQAIRIDPEYAKAWAGLGTCYFKTGRDQDAIDAFRQAIRIDPELVGGWLVWRLPTMPLVIGQQHLMLSGSFAALIRIQPSIFLISSCRGEELVFFGNVALKPVVGGSPRKPRGFRVGLKGH